MSTESDIHSGFDALDTEPSQEFVAKLRTTLAHDIAGVAELDREAPRRPKRRRAVIAVAGLAAAAAALAGVVALRRDNTRHAPRIAASTPAPAPLVGTRWIYDGGLKPETIPTPVQFSIENGKFGAEDGCNSLGGDVRIDGDSLTFSTPSTTLVACTDPTGERRAFDNMLASHARFTIDGHQLVLTADDGTALNFHAGRIAITDTAVTVSQNDGPSKTLDDQAGQDMIDAAETAEPVDLTGRMCTAELGPTYTITFATAPTAKPDVTVVVQDYGCRPATIGSTTLDGAQIAQEARKALA